MKQYLLDSNVFIEAKNRYYSQGIAPSFWQWLKEDETVFTISSVKEEIREGDDGLKERIKDIKVINEQDLSGTEEIVTFINERYKKKAEIDKFFSKVADINLLVIARKRDMCLVTHEQPTFRNISHVIKIPDICKEFQINYCNTFKMLEERKICLGNSYFER